MIIKYTFNDNDFTQIIEKYLDEYGPFYAFNYKSIEEMNGFSNLVRQYDNYNDKYNEEKGLTNDEYKKLKDKILKLLNLNFRRYIENISPNSNWSTPGFNAKDLQEEKDYIFDEIKISLVKSIPDQWENGEVVYFVTSNETYITM